MKYQKGISNIYLDIPDLALLQKKRIIDVIFEVVCDYYDVLKENVRKPTKLGCYSKIKYIFAYYSKIECNYSAEQIAKVLNRKRSNIYNLLKKSNGFLDIDKDFKKEYKQIKNILCKELKYYYKK